MNISIFGCSVVGLYVIILIFVLTLFASNFFIYSYMKRQREKNDKRISDYLKAIDSELHRCHIKHKKIPSDLTQDPLHSL